MIKYDMFQTRIKKVQKALEKQNFDALLITSVSNIAYLTSFTHFSKSERNAYALITPSNLYILTTKLYIDALIPLTHLIPIDISDDFSFTNQIQNLLKKESIVKLGIEELNLTVAEYKKLTEIEILSLFPTEDIVEKVREIKNPEEISDLKKACQITDQAFNYILPRIKIGATEKELAMRLEYFIKKQGGEVGFPSIVAFGRNSAIPHHATSTKKLAKSDNVVLLDFGTSINGYCADMSRTVFVGKPPSKLKKMYTVVRTAQEKAISYLSLVPSQVEPGFTSKKLPQVRFNLTSSGVDKVARDYITSQGFPTIPHSVGHGIGLDVHELPHISPDDTTVLKPGMVITIEPGIYDAAVGGIRIEDDILITQNGAEVLTKSPKELRCV